MSVKKKSPIKKSEKKPDKYDITVAVPLTFDEAMKKIATDANEKMKRKKGESK